MSRITRRTIIPVNQVTPLTYRDGVTYIQLLTELSDYIKTILHPSLQHTVDQLVADVEAQMDKHHDQYVDGVQEFQRIHDAFMSDVNASLIALNDTAVSDLVEDTTSLLGQILRRTFEPHGEVHRNTYDRMGVVVPDELTYDQLQAAADEAAETGKRLWAAGELTTDQTLVIRSDADLSELTIQYTGNSVAVEVGDRGEKLFRAGGSLPRVINAAYDRHVGWGNSIGIALHNLDANVWTIPYVANFGVGMDMVGNGGGNAYNTITVGHLDDNKVNQRLNPSNNGWVNQNTFIGGRYGHNSESGLLVDGVRHVQMMHYERHPVNNNLWLNPSLEYGTPEYHVEFHGLYNQILNGRWEVPSGQQPRVYWGNGAGRNQIMFGYNAQNIAETWHAQSGNSNTVMSTGSSRLNHSSASGVLILENASSAASPIDVIMDPGATKLGYDLGTEYRVSRSANSTKMKRRTDEHPRIELDHQNGRIYLGDGGASNTSSLGAIGGNLLNLSGDWETRDSADGQAGKFLQVYVNGSPYRIPLLPNRD